VATNYQRTKEWLNLAFNNLKRVIRNYDLDDYAGCIFRIQLSIEQFQKSLIFLLGIQFKKIHEPSKILKSLAPNKINQIGKARGTKIYRVADLAEDIENEQTKTRNDIIKQGKLITPEERYDKTDSIRFIGDLVEIIEILIDLYHDFEDFDNEIIEFNKYYKKLNNYIKE
jgi:HEPN domain-containing protein